MDDEDYAGPAPQQPVNHYAMGNIPDFVAGLQFVDVETFMTMLRRLEIQLDRKSRACHSNNAQRRRFFCALNKTDKIPGEGSDMCPFSVFATIAKNGVCTIGHCMLTHTCNAAANQQALRRKLSVSAQDARELAGAVVGHTAHGHLARAMEASVAAHDMRISPSVAYNVVGEASKDRKQVLRDNQYATLAAFVELFMGSDVDNFGSIETDADGHFRRCLVIPGSAKRWAARGLLAPILTMDFSHTAGRATVQDALDAVNATAPAANTFENDGGDSDEDAEQGAADQHANAAQRGRGRPRMTTVTVGRVGVITARTFLGSRLVVALALCSSEDTEAAKFMLELTESHVRFAQHFRVVNFLVDRGPAINRAITEVYGDKAFIAHCIVHFKRNVLNRALGDKDTKSKINALLSRAGSTPLVSVFDDAMRQLQQLCPATHAYVMNHDPTQWAPCHLPFNPLGNTTSNDAEGFFASVASEKNRGDVAAFFIKAVSNEVSHLHAIKTDVKKSRGDMATGGLQSTLDKRRTDGHAAFKLACQIDENTVQLSPRSNDSITITVNLNDLSDKKTWCVCGMPAISLLPCMHVIVAVRVFNCQGGDITKVVPPATLFAFATDKVSSFNPPATSLLTPRLDVKRPTWLTVDLPATDVPEHAADRATPIRIAAPSQFTPALNSRIPSTGESAMREVALNNHRRQQVRVDLGTSGEDTRKRPAASSQASQAKRKVICPKCLQPGHFQKTCKATASATADDSGDEDDN